MFEKSRQSSLVFTMKYCVLLSLLFAWGCVYIHGAPVEPSGIEEGSCADPFALGAAEQALTKINQNRQEGYVFSLHRLSNVQMTKHGETGVVYYLTLDVVETNCSVLSKKDWKACETRATHDTPVYGHCKAVIYMNRAHRVVRLYKYNCAVRPAPAARVSLACPDCPSHVALDNAEIQKTVSLSLEKFNKESGLANRFALLKVARATSGYAMSNYYNAEYSIQETTCPKNTEATDNCPLMDCEFSHKGFCKASHFHTPTGESEVSVECEIFEPEAAKREKGQHLLGGETDHSHSDANAHSHDHDQAHAADQSHTHDHAHDHTKSHAHHDKTLKHSDNSDHHHTHDHAGGHRHAHAHSHDHGHGHDHVHAHHAKAHDHSGDFPNQHHNYKHADGVHTHEHDHEIALDHDHKHAHLHEHEHHHHHHDHTHETTAHDHPEGIVRMLPALGQPVTLPSFPDAPAAGPEVGVTLPLKPDPQIPGEMEPTIKAFPTSVSAQCPPAEAGDTLVGKLFSEDPLFKTTA